MADLDAFLAALASFLAAAAFLDAWIDFETEIIAFTAIIAAIFLAIPAFKPRTAAFLKADPFTVDAAVGSAAILA